MVSKKVSIKSFIERNIDMTNSIIEAVIFDLDGVITDTAHFHFLAWKQLAEELNIEIDEEFNEKLKGISRMDSLELILKKGNKENDFTLSEKEEMAARKNSHYRHLLKELTPKDILPGIIDLVQNIKAEGLPTAIASVSKNAPTVLKALGMEGTFDYVVDAAKINNSKPDPEIFLTASEKLNVNPRNCIGIEDAAAGVEAIKGSQMFAVGVGANLAKADLRVLSTNQLEWESIKTAYQKANR
jgi:beta-phosphoglucomutase